MGIYDTNVAGHRPSSVIRKHSNKENDLLPFGGIGIIVFRLYEALSLRGSIDSATKRIFEASEFVLYRNGRKTQMFPFDTIGSLLFASTSDIFSSVLLCYTAGHWPHKNEENMIS